MNIEEYVTNVKNCTDHEELKDKYGIYDNWMALLYGKPEDVTNNLCIHFLDWKLYDDSDYSTWFENGDGIKGVISKEQRFVCTEFPEHKINGEHHSRYVMFHPKRAGLMFEVKNPILDCIDYMIRTQQTFRLPDEEINFIPIKYTKSNI